MTSKRILALSITSAMVLAACQQPTAAPIIGTPTIVSTTPGAVVNAGSNGIVTVVTTGGANGGAVSSVTGNGTACTATSTNNYTCTVSVPSTAAAGNFPVTVLVTNNAPAGSNTASTTANLTVNRPTGPGPIDTNPIPGAPTVTIANNGNGVVQIGATAGGTTTLKSVVVTVAKQGGSDTVFPIAGAVGQTSINQPFDISAALATPGTYTVSVKAINSSDLNASASLSSSITIVAPPVQGGGNSPVNGGVFNRQDPIATADINADNQYRWADIDQVLPGQLSSTRLRYVRGTFGIADVPALTGLPSGANITYYLSNTTTNPSNIIVGNVNTSSLNQGQIYFIIARRTNPDGSIVDAGNIDIVPDNLGPQVPKIEPQSRLNPALTSEYGNWINRDFSQTLLNTRSLEDKPVVPGDTSSTNPQGNTVVPGTGFSTLNYFAMPVANTFVGDPGDNGGLPINAAGNYDLTKAINLGGVSGNVNLTENYKINVVTAAATAGKVLGDGRYVIFAVAFDNLGNRNLIDFQDSYILNVDNTGPTGNLRVVDRGPLDINATTALCRRVDIVTATGRPDLAPTDVFTALQNQSLTFKGVAYTGVNYVSGCALASATINDSGVGFDSANIQGLLPGTINAPQGAQTIGNGLTLATTSRSTASLPVSVINLNTVSDGLQPFTIQATDLLGNMSILPAANVFVDNAAPSNINVSVASQNGSDVFNAWQSVGVSATAEDNVGSGPRTASGTDGPTDSFTTNKNFTFYYGTDPIDERIRELGALSQRNTLAYDNVLVQINQSAVENTSGSQLGGLFSSKANFNIPNPANSRSDDRGVRLEDNKLNIWAMVADKAGNAAANRTQVIVNDTSTNTPTITPDRQGIFGQIENGDNFPYKGFTVLNRNTNGNVPLRTIDQLPALGITGPDALQAFGPNPGPVPGFPLLTDYRQLPNTGTPATGTGTNFYRLSVQDADKDGIDFRGNINQNTGIGRVTFAYRIPDPVQAQDNGDALRLNGVNPFDYWPSVPYAYRTTGGSVVYGAGSAPLAGTPANKDSGYATKAACDAVFASLNVVCANKAANIVYPFGSKEGDFITLPGDARPKEGGGTFFPLIVSSPSDLEYNIERKGRFLYNLPSWSGGNLANGSAAVPEENRIKHIWNNIADVEKGPFQAFFDSRLSILQPQDDSGRPELPDNILFKRSAIGVFAYNNYGNVDIQIKGITSGIINGASTP